LGDQARRLRWTGHGAHMGKKRGACGVLMGKPEGKRPLGMCTGFIWLRIGRGDRLL